MKCCEFLYELIRNESELTVRHISFIPLLLYRYIYNDIIDEELSCMQ